MDANREWVAAPKRFTCGWCRAEVVQGSADDVHNHGPGKCDSAAQIPKLTLLTLAQKTLLFEWKGFYFVPHGAQSETMQELLALRLVNPNPGVGWELTEAGREAKRALTPSSETTLAEGNPVIRGPDADRFFGTSRVDPNAPAGSRASTCDHPTPFLTTEPNAVKCKRCGWRCEGSNVIAQVVARLIGEAEAAEPGETLLSRKEAERLAKEAEAPKEPNWFEKRGITEGDWNQRCDEALAGKDAALALQPLLAENATLRRRLESLERKAKR